MRSDDEESSITESSGNVFIDLGFDEAEAALLTLRAEVMLQIFTVIRSRKLTQVQAAKLLGVSQSRVSDLMRGKSEKFSLDMLVLFAAKLGIPARLELAA